MIVLALSALIATPLYMVAQGAFRTERAQGHQMDVEAQLERVANQIEDDVREGLPSARRTGSPADELALRLVSDRSEQVVLWTRDGTQLRRRAFDAVSGTIASNVVLLHDIPPAQGSIFRYWESSGVEISPTSTARIVDCATRVTIDLRSVVGSVEIGRSIDVAHRSPNPGAPSC